MQEQIPHEMKFLLERHGARLVKKRGWFWNTLHWIVAIITFGGNRSFKTGFVTTLGPIIAVPEEWNPWRGQSESTIIHELVHVQQFKRFGFGNAWLGLPLMFLLYVLLPLPVGGAWFRWMFEREAYLENLRRDKRIGLGDGYMEVHAMRVVERLFGGAYGWTLPPLPCVKRYGVRWLLKNV